MTKKELIETVKKLKEENLELKDMNTELIEQRRALVEEVENLANHEDTFHEVFTALGENLKKSLKAKNIINMNEEERNAMYYMTEHFISLCESAEDETIMSVLKSALKR
jgi:hypothetical protein